VITNGLGFLPFGNGVHYDADETRRTMLHEAVAAGELPTSYAADNGVALLYEDTELVNVIADREGPSAYRVELSGGAARETRLPARVIA
jgi:hypothetical protein